MSLLPKSFQQNPTISKLYRIFEDKQIFFSSIVYLSNNKNYVIIKKQTTPHFQLDWQCYSLLRSYAKTIISSGVVVRTQHGLYQSQFARGDQNITEMYHNFRVKQGQKQNIFVMTNTMDRQEILPYFNQNIYNVFDSSCLEQKQQPNQADTFEKVLEYLVKSDSTPVLVECGPKIMNRYYEDVLQNKKKNLVDTIYLAFFEGDLDQDLIGGQLPISDQLYEVIWQTQKHQIHQNGKFIGYVHFKVYSSRQQ